MIQTTRRGLLVVAGVPIIGQVIRGKEKDAAMPSHCRFARTLKDVAMGPLHNFRQVEVHASSFQSGERDLKKSSLRNHLDFLESKIHGIKRCTERRILGTQNFHVFEILDSRCDTVRSQGTFGFHPLRQFSACLAHRRGNWLPFFVRMLSQFLGLMFVSR